MSRVKTEDRMRWSYFFPRLLIVAFVWGFLAFGMDPLLRNSAVCRLKSATGENASVGKLTTTLFPPSLTINNVALANPQRSGTNIAEFDELHLNLEPRALSKRQFVVVEGWMRGLRFAPAFSDDWSAEQTPELATYPAEMTEQLDAPGQDILGGITQQAQTQLDFNLLETFRTGAGLYEKWHDRFEDLTSRAKTIRKDVRRLDAQFRKAEEGNAVQQIEQYFQLGHRAETAAVDIQNFDVELRRIRHEIQSDFQLLQDVRTRDQENIRQGLAESKPDPRRISQALLENSMRNQLHRGLTLITCAERYRKQLLELVSQTPSDGHHFQFHSGKTPSGLSIRNLTVTGTWSLDQARVPFNAIVTDLSEDPGDTERPCVLEIVAETAHRFRLRLVDHSTDTPPTMELLVDHYEHNPLSVLAGKPSGDCVRATLRDLHWRTHLEITNDQIAGSIGLQSQVDGLHLETSDIADSGCVESANEAFSRVTVLNASGALSGSTRNPVIAVESGSGEQIGSEIQRAFSERRRETESRLLTEIDTCASDQMVKLNAGFKAEFDTIVAENQALLHQVNTIRASFTSLPSAEIGAASPIRQVNESRLTPARE
ncbi:MAG TPA: hypothetical protein PLY87_13700 [Planctomycetaceae bacterium]|nr:hypothetical protein [Planctomycetaceae bacterium]